MKRHRWKTTEDLENQIFNSMLKRRHYREKKVFNGVKYLQSNCKYLLFFLHIPIKARNKNVLKKNPTPFKVFSFVMSVRK